MIFLFFLLISINFIYCAEISTSYKDIAKSLGNNPLFIKESVKSKFYKQEKETNKNYQAEKESCNICDQEETIFIHANNFAYHNAKKHLDYINLLIWNSSVYEAYDELKKFSQYKKLDNLSFVDFENSEICWEFFKNLEIHLFYKIRVLAKKGDQTAIDFIRKHASIRLTKKEMKQFLNE